MHWNISFQYYKNKKILQFLKWEFSHLLKKKYLYQNNKNQKKRKGNRSRTASIKLKIEEKSWSQKIKKITEILSAPFCCAVLQKIFMNKKNCKKEVVKIIFFWMWWRPWIETVSNSFSILLNHFGGSNYFWKSHFLNSLISITALESDIIEETSLFTEMQHFIIKKWSGQEFTRNW